MLDVIKGVVFGYSKEHREMGWAKALADKRKMDVVKPREVFKALGSPFVL